MSQVISAAEFNALFASALNGGAEEMHKLGEATGLYVQDKLRENAFCRKILPPQTVTESELTRNVNDEGLSYIDDIEPDSIAMHINWRGEPNKTYIQGKRYAIPMSTITSERFQKSEQELRSYRMPLTKVIEQNTVKDIQEQEDFRFMQHVKAGIFLATLARHNELLNRGVITLGTAGTNDADPIVSAAGASLRNFANEAEFISYLFRHDKFGAARTNGGGVLDITNFGTPARPSNQAQYANIILSADTKFTRTALRDLIKVQANRQLKAKCFLLHESDYADVLAWDASDAGYELVSEIVKDGYKYATIGGYTFVTTVRDNPDIIEPGQIFAFPDPAFLGRFLLLENTKFFIKKEGRFITMEAWEDVGMGFGNVKGLAVLLLNGAKIDLPAVWQKPAGTTSGVGANANEDGYDSATNYFSGSKVRIVNDITSVAVIAANSKITTQA